MERRPRVWITGGAAVSALGVGRRPFWEGVLSGRAAFGEPPPSGGLRAPGPAATLALAGFAAEEYADPRYVRRLSALSRAAVVAGRLAMEDAAYPQDPRARDETGVALGTAFGSTGYHFEYYEALFRRGLKEASPLLFSESVLNAASGHLSQYLRLRGPCLTLVGGEEAGLAAVATALDRVRGGTVPAMLAGGAEEHCPILHRALVEGGVVRGWEPSAGGVAGAPLAEGAALVLLEECSAARVRGARPIAEVLGAGWGRAGPEGALEGEHVFQAAREACRDAGVEPAGIGLVVGGADGGALDGPEARGLHRILEERPVRVLSPKKTLGEGFAFTSAAQVLIAALALSTGEVPREEGGAPGSIASSHALAVSSTRRGGACAVVVGYDGAGHYFST